MTAPDALPPAPGTPLPYPWVATAAPAPDFWSGHRAPLPGLAVVGVAVTAVVGAAVSFAAPGIGLTLLALAAWLAGAPLLVRSRRWTDLALACGSVALFGVFAWRASPLVLGLATVVGLAAGVVAALGSSTVLGILVAPAMTVASGVRAMPWFVRGVAHRVQGSGRRVWGVVASSALAVALVLVVGALFASADPVFAQLAPDLSVRDLPGRVIVGGFWAWVAGTVAHVVLAPPPLADARVGRVRPGRLTEWLIPVLALTALVVTFLAVQLDTLLGDAAGMLDRTGLTYAEYARQGFGQLLAATALTALVAAVAAWRAPRATRSQRLWTGGALVGLCLATLGVVASALRRMTFYTQVYGLSQLRVAASWAELVLGGCLLLGVLAAVRGRATWLPRGVVGLLVVAVLALAAWNPDARIVASQRATGQPLDVAYLSELSSDALPAVAGLPAQDRDQVLDALIPNPAGWASWSWSRHRAGQVVDAVGLSESGS